MNIFTYFFIALTWFFSIMSLVTLYTGYADPVMIICSVIFFLGATGFGFMAKASLLPKPTIKIEEVSPEHLINTLDQPAYLRRGLGHDEQQ